MPKKLPSNKEMEKALEKSHNRTKKERTRSHSHDSGLSSTSSDDECYQVPFTCGPCVHTHPLRSTHSRLSMPCWDYCEDYARRRSEADLFHHQDCRRMQMVDIERERAEQEHKRKLEQDSLEAFVSGRAERHSRQGTQPSHDEVVLEDALCNAEYRRWWQERQLREEIMDLKAKLQEREEEGDRERLNYLRAMCDFQRPERGRRRYRRRHRHHDHSSTSPIRSVSSSPRPRSPRKIPELSPDAQAPSRNFKIRSIPKRGPPHYERHPTYRQRYKSPDAEIRRRRSTSPLVSHGSDRPSRTYVFRPRRRYRSVSVDYPRRFTTRLVSPARVIRIREVSP